MSATFLTDLKGVAAGGIGTVPGTSAVTTETDTDGTAVDMQLSDGPIHGIFLFGATGDSSLELTLKLVESDASGGTYTLVPGASLALGANTSGTLFDNSVHYLSTNQRTKRYVKTRVTTAGSGSLTATFATVVLGRKKIVGTGPGNQL